MSCKGVGFDLEFFVLSVCGLMEFVPRNTVHLRNKEILMNLLAARGQEHPPKNAKIVDVMTKLLEREI